MDAVDIIRVGQDKRVLTSIGCFLLYPVGIRRGSNVIRFPSASALRQAGYRFKSFFRTVLMVAIPAHPSVRIPMIARMYSDLMPRSVPI